MEQGPLAELGRQVLADLFRQSLSGKLSDKRSVSTALKGRRPSAMPVEGDLPSYLRSIHRLLTAEELATLLHCHRETLYRRIKRDQIPTIKDNGRWKFDPGRVATWIEEQMGRPTHDEESES